jgi:hypothetical protein
LKQNGELRLHNRILRLETSKAKREFLLFSICDFPIFSLFSSLLSFFSPLHLLSFLFLTLFFIGTAFFGYLSDAPISRDEVLAALQDRGCLENVNIKDFVDRNGRKSTYGLVTFAYPDDYADALSVSLTTRSLLLLR